MASGARAAEPGAAANLEGVVVTGERRADAALLTQPALDTPQSILAITAEVIQLGGLNDVRDVLKLDPSVSAHADEDNAQGTNVQIRGFSARNDLYRDGQLDLGRYYRDAFDLEAVHVLTGPSSVLFGRGSTGGAIVEISKHPMADRFQKVAASGGSDGLARLTADLNNPLSANAAWRISAMAHRSGIAGRDSVNTQRVGLSPVVTLGLNTPTELTIGLLHQAQWDRPDYGVPWIDIAPPGSISRPAAVPWNNFYGFKDDYSRISVDIATASLSHTLSEAWALHSQLRYAVYGRRFRATDPVVGPVIQPTTPLSSVTVTRTMRGGRSHERYLGNQTDLTGRFEGFGLTHTLVLGADLGRQSSSPTLLRYSGVPGTNLVNPQSKANFTGVVTPRSIIRFKADTAAAFVGDTIEIGDRWQVTAAARIDRFAADYSNALPKLVTFRHVDVRPSWRAAATWRVAPEARAYVMYGTSFNPSAEGLSLSASTADLAPERNRTAEAGVKWNARPALLLSAAVFRTVKFNAREPSPVDPTLTILAGTARTQGAELQVQGHVSPRWVVVGGYTYLEAEIISSPNKDAGQPLQNAPRHSFRMFSAYEATPKLTLGGALNALSSRVPSSVPDPNGFRQRVPGYWTLSALARYQLTPRVQVQLNADNLLDRRYYDGLDDNHVNVGAGRSVHLAVQAEF